MFCTWSASKDDALRRNTASALRLATSSWSSNPSSNTSVHSDDPAGDWGRVWELAGEIAISGVVSKRVGESSPRSLGCKLPEELATGVWFLLVFVHGSGVFRLEGVTGNARTGFGRSGECFFERSWFCQYKVVRSYWKFGLITVVKLYSGKEYISHCFQRTKKSKNKNIQKNKQTNRQRVPKCQLVKFTNLEVFVIPRNWAENLPTFNGWASRPSWINSDDIPTDWKIHRGYYLPARGYEFYLECSTLYLTSKHICTSGQVIFCFLYKH